MLNPNTTITTDTTPQAPLIYPGHELYDVARSSWNLTVDQQPACIWPLHDLWPDWEIPNKALIQPGWQTKITGRAARCGTPIYDFARPAE